MADEEHVPSPTPGVRRRPATVIDLEATEVPPESAAPGAVSPEPPTDTSSEPPREASSEPQRDPPHAEPASQPRPERSGRSDRLVAAAIGAGLGGVAGAALAFAVLWFVGLPTNAPAAATDLGPRLAQIEKQLAELAARPAPAGGDPKALDNIAGRLDRVESALATPRPPATDPVVLGRLTATETAVKTAADNIAGLSRRADAVDATLRNTGGRIDKLAQTGAETLATARQAAAGSDRASRLAIAASALRGAVERGDPFTAELEIIKPLTSDADAVAAIEPFARTGVPTAAALARELAAVVRAQSRAEAQKPSGGSFLDRLSTNAEKLVRIRPVGEARGGDRDSDLVRAERRAAQGDIGGAMTELAKLPSDARGPVQSWIAKAQARQKALDAGRKLSSDAVTALKASP